MHITLFVIVYTIVQLFIASPVAEEVYAFAFKQKLLKWQPDDIRVAQFLD